MESLSAPSRSDWLVERVLSKVPEVTLLFWVIKVLSTTVGETGADYLAVHVGLGTGLTMAFMIGALVVVIAMQVRQRRFVSWLYWLTVVLVSVVGTQITDVLTDRLGVSLYVSTTAFSIALAILFLVWYRVERTVSISEIDTRRREAFYWGAILLTFALGTAAGDLATEALGLGFTVGAVVFTTLIALTAIAWRLGAGAVLCFWITYILTRPLGASLGDLLAQAREYGGLGLGTSVTSITFLVIICALVAWSSFKQPEWRKP